MAPLNAWVTSVKTGRAGGSRLNFLSATVSVDIAERLLRPDRPDLPLGERARVLIGSPYRPQARLVNLLIKDAELEREVVPGTAHTFQGSEAPVVIFDLVLDEPHRQAGLFDPRRNEDNLRLLNVALTRARRRLIVLGDFNWVEQHANRHSSLRELVHFLRGHYPLVSALDVVTDGLQTRAAEAHQLIVGGDDAPSHRRIVVTQEHFYPLLVRDIDAAAGTSWPPDRHRVRSSATRRSADSARSFRGRGERDPRHLFQAAKNGIDYFVTCDKGITNGANKIEAEVSMRVRTPSRLVAEIG